MSAAARALWDDPQAQAVSIFGYDPKMVVPIILVVIEATPADGATSGGGVEPQSEVAIEMSLDIPVSQEPRDPAITAIIVLDGEGVVAVDEPLYESHNSVGGHGSFSPKSLKECSPLGGEGKGGELWGGEGPTSPPQG